MTQKTESKWQTLRRFLEGYMQEDTTYRAGAIYEAYLNEGGSAEISRKDFEMFLRDQVMKDDGMLKRTSHGVYEIRTDQSDRGVFFTRGSQSTEQPSIDLAEILDDSVELTARIRSVFDSLNKLDGIPFPAQMELSRLKASLLHSMDSAVTGITATMSWSEDNMDMDTQDETETINMDAASFGQNAYFYDAAEGLLTATILLVAEFCEPEKRHIVSVFKIIQELLAPSQKKGKNQFQQLMEMLPDDHKAKWFAGAALNTAEQSMASVMSTALSRLNSFLDSELEQLLCFDTEIDAEKFCNEKSAIFVVMPEENPNTCPVLLAVIN